MIELECKYQLEVDNGQGKTLKSLTHLAFFMNVCKLYIMDVIKCMHV